MDQVAVVVPYVGRWYFDEVRIGALEAVRRAGGEATVVVPTTIRDGGGHWTEVLDDAAVEGVVLVGYEPTPAEVKRIRDGGVPVVVVGGRAPGLPSVGIDDAAAASLATQHLIDLGHRRIVHLAGTVVNQMGFAVHGARIRGYVAAMERAGLSAECRIVASEYGRRPVRSAAIAALRDADRPTALFAVSDEVAVTVLDVAAENELRVPADLSVVGIDDHPLAGSTQLTTVRQDPKALGAAAVDLLVDEPRADRVLLQPVTLVERTSTAPERPRRRFGLRRRADAKRG